MKRVRRYFVLLVVFAVGVAVGGSSRPAAKQPGSAPAIRIITAPERVPGTVHRYRIKQAGR